MRNQKLIGKMKIIRMIFDINFHRDHFIEILFEHANLDMNAFVRSRAVNSLAALVKAESFPIKKSHDLVDLGVKILLDKSGLVRKAGLQLLTGLLAWNPFGANVC